MMLEASLLRFGGRGAFLNVLYVRCFAYTVSECGTKHLLKKQKLFILARYFSKSML